jgi:hypothetical protein
MANGTTSVSRQDVCDAFQGLFDQLNDGYWAATTIEDKDRIKGTADAVFEILTQLNQEDIESRDSDFKALTGTVKGIIPRLDKLKNDIDKIIHAVKIAGTVAQALDTAINLAVKYFK